MRTVIKKIALTLPLVALLAYIRLKEGNWFYDPFSYYFNVLNSKYPYPQFDALKLYGATTAHYILNTVISLGIIYLLFKNKDFIKLATLMYSALFIVLIIAYIILTQLDNQAYNLVLFYVRRFLTQPVFLILFIPAFFFQQKSQKA